MGDPFSANPSGYTDYASLGQYFVTGLVSQAGTVFERTYPEMSFRGTANGWGTKAMNLVSNYTCLVETTFGGGTSERLKFDVYGDWSLNFGDNQNDGIADQSGNDILITQGAGTHRITFNEQSRAFSVSRLASIEALGLPIRELTPWERYYQIDLLINDQWQDDPDGDGLINPEEMYHDTHPFEADTDGDGLSDFDEVIAGTSPVRGGEFFAVALERSTNGIGLSWSAAPGRVYTVQGALATGAGWQTLDVVEFTGDEMAPLEIGASAWVAEGFGVFRVKVEFPGRED